MLTSWPPSSSSQLWLLHSEAVASETPEAKPPAGKQLKKPWAIKKTEHCSQWIAPGLGNHLITIFAISFSEPQNIDKLLLSLSEAWNNDQVTAFDPESPEFKAFRQSAISRRHSDLRSAEARNPQKHEAPNQNSKQNKQLYLYIYML